MNSVESLGVFGNHPDPSIDFCCEVDKLEGWAVDVKENLRSQWPFWGRLSALLKFIRTPEFAALDEIAQKAKPIVHELEGRVIDKAPRRQTPWERIAELETALEPFAAIADAPAWRHQADECKVVTMHFGPAKWLSITLVDLRRAKAALGGSDDG